MANTERKIVPVPKEENLIQPDKIVFYCKKCEKIVVAIQTKRKFKFKCPECKKTEIAFGTETSVKNFYHVKDEVKVDNTN